MIAIPRITNFSFLNRSPVIDISLGVRLPKISILLAHKNLPCSSSAKDIMSFFDRFLPLDSSFFISLSTLRISIFFCSMIESYPALIINTLIFIPTNRATRTLNIPQRTRSRMIPSLVSAVSPLFRLTIK